MKGLWHRIREQPTEAVFWLLMGVAMVAVWQSKWFLTGDGPTHLYNARILLDHWLGESVDFYADWYRLNPNPEPNWTGHVLLAGLLWVFPAWLAEKVMLSAILLLFLLGAKYAVRSVDPEKGGFALFFFPFAMADPFHLGFYNFGLSLGIFFFLIGFYLRKRDKMGWKTALVLALWLLAAFFTHPVSLGVAALVMGVLFLHDFIGNGISARFRGREFWQKYIPQGGWSLLSFLPTLGFLFLFLGKKGTKAFGYGTFGEMLGKLWELNGVVWQPPKEAWLGTTLVVLCTLMLLSLLLFSFFRDGKAKGRGLGLAFLAALLLYFFAPDNLAGGGVIHLRLQLYPFFLLFLWAVRYDWNPMLRKVLPLSFALLFCLQFALRIGTYRKLGRAVAELVETGSLVPAESTLLPLSFAHAGKDEQGNKILNGMWMFVHASDYCGAVKPLILFDNYEGNTGFFPVIWKENRNPYLHLGAFGGHEALPPGANMRGYAEKTEGEVEYVLTWCLDETFAEQESVVDLKDQLGADYRLKTVSESGRVRLFERKP